MLHTTNYFNTFIEIAEDCKLEHAEEPPAKKETKSIAQMQFEMLIKNPYKYTSDDILFQVFADRKEITSKDYESARESFFSKGQPCFRASPLTKQYGWGIHYNADGKMAIYPAGSDEYNSFISNKELKVIKAMKSKR